ncbi:MAG: 2-amino-4-hydroxy-6-hydroxymethyldihydropteridine diphosphokinase [Deltaproteobacteria bacterium]|nr:2-amino-4-hydroxy-6-hydroxymethyldihydropteridine diphosphokinase [Deltaproteobacteria bacterium]
MSALAFIAIGSNLGDRLAFGTQAIDGLRAYPAIAVLAQSTWREYAALTLPPHDPQPAYLNGVVQIRTTLEPAELLAVCHQLERDAGRPRRDIALRWGPRTLDLDLLAYNTRCVDIPGLTLPHPELHKRRFVLEPLCDIDPNWLHPRLGRTAHHLLEALICNSS